jgi:dethiobiotin synthetase
VTAQILFITGTDTDVGKTIATAALAATLASQPSTHGRHRNSIAVDKPVQTGVSPQEDGDIDVIRQLAGVASATEGIRLRRPMAPVAAAQREGVALPGVTDHAARIEVLAHAHDHVLVEGAGGLLVHLDSAGNTLADLAALFGERAAVIVVVRSGLGTLNHTELTLHALTHRGLPVAGIIIGSWPRDPDEIALDNQQYLSSLDVPLLAAIPAHSSQLDASEFRLAAPSWFANM